MASTLLAQARAKELTIIRDGKVLKTLRLTGDESHQELGDMLRMHGYQPIERWWSEAVGTWCAQIAKF